MKFASQICSKHKILPHAKRMVEEDLDVTIEENEEKTALEDRI